MNLLNKIENCLMFITNIQTHTHTFMYSINSTNSSIVKMYRVI